MKTIKFKSLVKVPVCAALLLAFLVAASSAAVAQSATPVPKLDPARLIGTYYEIARYPIRREKSCLANEMVLYALGDKKNTLQIVTTCEVKDGNSNSSNYAGKFDKSGDGKIKLGWIWPFAKKYWVLDLAPDYTWALVGTPNHKSLWILSRAVPLAPEVLVEIETKATAQGFNAAKLVKIVQR